VGGVDHDQLRLAGAIVGEADHVVTRSEAVHACAHGLHHTGKVRALAGREGRRPALMQQALADLGLARVDPGGPHPHQQLARTGNRVRHVDHVEDINAAVLVIPQRVASHSLLDSITSGYRKPDWRWSFHT
jgi:hypothetical protein